MKLPENLKYTAQHLWVRQEANGTCFSGITDYAQVLEAGKPCGLVESVKTGSDLHAPLNGTVESVNEKLKDNPELINDAPYDAWVFSIQTTVNGQDGLLSAAEYQQLLGEIK